MFFVFIMGKVIFFYLQFMIISRFSIVIHTDDHGKSIVLPGLGPEESIKVHPRSRLRLLVHQTLTFSDRILKSLYPYLFTRKRKIKISKIFSDLDLWVGCHTT